MQVVELHPQLEREWKTLKIMINMYCADNHSSDKLCMECQQLQDYAFVRLQNCIFQENKPTCANCPRHCYRKSKKRQMREVMKYAGPKMVFKHPILAIKHLWDGKKKVELPIMNI